MVRIVIDNEPVTDETIHALLGIPARLQNIEQILIKIQAQESREALDISALAAKIEVETSIDKSIYALIEGLGDLDPTLAGIARRLKKSSGRLLAAIKANTPSSTNP